ncbi:ABC transporter ATP-binding protein [Cupriavidus cauae]|uniref:ABC transporter ATP-binding protein n=1 Tax=Cupriavidus cauae TaxID=2608999 RepID=UPI00224303C7|nr:ABC transporter ATP-binding protein [Cupriavidus cauae]UZN48601.1 ABC transporter ATP-binding protein [Cupriavidus cauae]
MSERTAPPSAPHGASDPAPHAAPHAAPPLLRLADVQTHIGPYHILHGVTLDVPRGGVTMLLGRNGAGKTTTLRTVMGLWRASAGRIEFDGRDITALDTPAIAQAGIGYVPENMGVFSDLTVAENLRLAARQGPADPRRLDWVLRMFPALKVFWHQRAGVLSGGQKQMLSVARAIVEPRRLLIVDEPTKGLAPAIIQNMIAVFRELKQTEVSMLLVEQNFQMARAVGDTVAVMDDGRVVHAGSMAQLAADEGLQQRLLGLSLAAHQ